jgi:hypothetical protein
MRSATVASLLVTMLAGACGGTSEQPKAEAEQAQESSVSVKLTDFVVEAESDSVPAGRVTFDVTNGAGTHDLYVLRTDLPAGDLPEDEPGTLTRRDPETGELETLDLLERGPNLEPDVEVDKPNLRAPEIDVLGSIEPMEAGEIDSLTLDLESGHYVLMCNLVEFEFDQAGNLIEEVGDSHYELGMRTDFSVR